MSSELDTMYLTLQKNGPSGYNWSMAIRRGNRHQFTFDGQTVWLDSLTEERALRKIVEVYGFGGKWLRPKQGIMHHGRQYTPDFELSVADGERTSRAIVEVKQYRRDLPERTVGALIATAKHFSTKDIFLYTEKGDNWFRVNARSGHVAPCPPPLPGKLDIKTMWRPRSFGVRNMYGRRYRRSLTDMFLSLIEGVMYPDLKRGRKRKC